MAMDFYYVSSDFIDYLQDVERKARGFTRVPNVEYDKNQNQKFVVGIVLQVNGFKYYAPMSHYKIQKPNNVLINIAADKINPIKGSIRFNYMFPVLDEYLTQVKINELDDIKYKRLVQKELRFCIDNAKDIQTKALKTYLDVILGNDSALLSNACDFRLLEEALKNIPPLQNKDEETEDSGKGLTLVK